MKAPVLVLIGLGIFVITLVAWLQLDRASEFTPPARPNTSGAGGELQRPVGSSAEVVRAAAEPSHAATPDQETASTVATSSALGRALALPAGFERQQLLERFGFDAAKDGLAAALQTLAGVTAPADRQALLRGIFARAAEAAPADAINAVNSLTAAVDRETALAALVGQWRPTPVPFEEQRFLADKYGSLGAILARLGDDPSFAAECAKTLLTGFEKVSFLGAAAGRQAATDPQRALSFGAGLEGNERTQFLSAFVAGWAGSSGDAAWAWSLQEPDAAVRQMLQASALQGWATQDPQNAAVHLAQIENAEARQKVINAIGAAWGSSDTQAGFAWANSLSNPGERDAALAAISSMAPVGIGVVLKMGESGYPVVGGLVPGGPASLAGGMGDGYEIAAISERNGAFTDLRGRSMQDIVSLLRGKPGSSVYLQVIEPGGNPAARRTIVMTRQQLFFKRSGS